MPCFESIIALIIKHRLNVDNAHDYCRNDDPAKLGLTRIHVPRNMDVGGLFVTWVNIFKSLKHANVGSIVVSIICISILVPIKVLKTPAKTINPIKVGFEKI